VEELEGSEGRWKLCKSTTEDLRQMLQRKQSQSPKASRRDAGEGDGGCRPLPECQEAPIPQRHCVLMVLLTSMNSVGSKEMQ